MAEDGVCRHILGEQAGNGLAGFNLGVIGVRAVILLHGEVGARGDYRDHGGQGQENCEGAALLEEVEIHNLGFNDFWQNALFVYDSKKIRF